MHLSLLWRTGGWRLAVETAPEGLRPQRLPTWTRRSRLQQLQGPGRTTARACIVRVRRSLPASILVEAEGLADGGAGDLGGHQGDGDEADEDEAAEDEAHLLPGHDGLDRGDVEGAEHLREAVGGATGAGGEDDGGEHGGGEHRADEHAEAEGERVDDALLPQEDAGELAWLAAQRAQQGEVGEAAARGEPGAEQDAHERQRQRRGGGEREHTQ